MPSSVKVNPTIIVEIDSLRSLDGRKLIRQVDTGLLRDVREVPGAVVDQQVRLRRVFAAGRLGGAECVERNKCVEIAVVIEVRDHDGFAATAEFDGMAAGIAKRVGHLGESAIAVIEEDAGDILG